MKKAFRKLVSFCKMNFGYGIMLMLFCGVLIFGGYLIAMFLGGDYAKDICEFMYNSVVPVLVRTTTGLVIFGLVIMYLDGEEALTAKGKK